MNERSKTARRLSTVIFAALIAVGMMAVMPEQAHAAEPKGIGAAIHSQEEIRNHIEKSGSNFKQRDEYSKQFTEMETLPVTADSPAVGLDDIGELSEATQNNALAVLNNFRYIAGLEPVSITDDTSRKQKIQAGMYLNYLNKEINHYPSQPANASKELFDAGYAGTSSSNIAWGLSTLPYAVAGWSDDSDSGNISSCGHRRWMLNPEMGKTAFGGVDSHYAMYSEDSSRTSDLSGIAWPAANMPIDYLFSDYGVVWTYTCKEFFDRDTTTVTLTKLDQDGNPYKKWVFDKNTDNNSGTKLYYNVSNSGQYNPNTGYYENIVAQAGTGTVIFRPAGAGYHDGDQFHVHIENDGKEIADYDVNLFALKPVTALQLEDSYAEANGATFKIRPVYVPSDCSDKHYTVKVDDESVVAFDSSKNKFTALKNGSTRVTFTASNGVSATTTIRVLDSEIEDPTDKTFVYEGKSHSPISAGDTYQAWSGTAWRSDRDYTTSETEPGYYFCYVVPKTGFKWKSDGTTDKKIILWEIDQAENSLTQPLTCSDITYPEKPSPEAKLKEGESTYEFSTSESGSYSSDIPSKPGTYYVRVKAAATDHYKKFVSDPVEFQIRKAQNSWTSELTMENIFYGQKPEPKAAVKGGDVSYEYSNQKDGTYSKDIPTEPGTYYVRAVSTGDDCFEAITSEPVEFRISRAANSWTTDPSIPDITYGQKPEPKASAKDGEVYFEYSTQKDGDYTSTVPTDAGTYYVIAAVNQTNHYEAIKSSPIEFQIRKAANSWTSPLAVADTEYGTPVKPSASSEAGTVYYRYSAEEDGNYTETVPSEVGKYYVKAFVDTTKNYESLTSDPKSFEITKAANSWSKKLTAPSTVKYGETFKPEAVPAHGADEAAVTYKYSASENGSYSETYPEKAGKYFVKAIFPATKNYQELESDPLSFEITKAENAWTTPLTAMNVKYGEPLDVHAEAAHGAVTYKYSADKNGTYTETEPSNAGTYYVKAAASETDNYLPLESGSMPFEITQAENSWSVPLAVTDTTYNGKPVSFSAEAKNGTAVVKYFSDEECTNEIDAPVNAGTYYAKAFVDETKNYQGLKSEAREFVIKKASNSWTRDLTVSDIEYGKTIKPNAEAKVGEVTYLYSDSEDGDYTETAPTEIGEYYVKAVVEASNNYTGLESKPAKFKIAAKPEPEPQPEPVITTITKNATEKQADTFIRKQKTDNDVKGSAFGLLQAKATKTTKSSITVTWKKVPGAKKYVVYANKCGRSNKFKKYKTLKGTKLKQTKLKKGTYYKYLILAIDKNGKVLSTSKTIHEATVGNKKKANFTGLKVNKTKLTLKRKKAYTLKATELKKRGTKVQRHRKPAFESSNPKVATVTSKGRVKALRKGSAKIYVYTQNGICKTVTVRVK